MMLMKFWFSRRLKSRCGDSTAMGNEFIRFCGIDGKLNVGISEGCWICGFHASNAASNKILCFSGFKFLLIVEKCCHPWTGHLLAQRETASARKLGRGMSYVGLFRVDLLF